MEAPISLAKSGNINYGLFENPDSAQDAIPYHAREYACPFTYGSLPENFKKSDLHHVPIEGNSDFSQNNSSQSVLPVSPATKRKLNRPCITGSRTILKKTPSREEFEEILMQRQELSQKEQIVKKRQFQQNAAIQKDLNKLHNKLNHKNTKWMQNVQTSQTKLFPKFVDENNQLALTSTESDTTRAEIPSFPVNKSSEQSRCVSPYISNMMVYPINAVTLSEPSFGIEKTKGKSKEGHIFNSYHEVASHLVKFAKDYSEYWYKPYLTREEANRVLRNAQPGTFLIRNSSTYKDAYGLVLRVENPPSVLTTKTNVNVGDELVRHFLLEPTIRGVHLKACANEPLFTSLSAFVYQHSITALALPCKLLIPHYDILHLSSNSQCAEQRNVFMQGAACNLLYLHTCNMESLTGDEAIRKAVFEMFSLEKLCPSEVQFKVAQQGITITDNFRRVFFRRHYIPKNISHIGIDPDGRYWSVLANDEGFERTVNKTIFGFVAKARTGSRDNECHIFCDLATSQPATAIVSFVKKVISFDVQTYNLNVL